jgi:hypothetical protein
MNVLTQIQERVNSYCMTELVEQTRKKKNLSERIDSSIQKSLDLLNERKSLDLQPVSYKTTNDEIKQRDEIQNWMFLSNGKIVVRVIVQGCIVKFGLEKDYQFTVNRENGLENVKNTLIEIKDIISKTSNDEIITLQTSSILKRLS